MKPRKATLIVGGKTISWDIRNYRWLMIRFSDTHSLMGKEENGHEWKECERWDELEMPEDPS